MNRLLHIKKIFLLIWVISIIGCDPENPTQGDQTRDNEEPYWKILGFEDKFAIKLEIEGDYLYVAAGRDGLWKMNLEGDSALWEYCGLGIPEMVLASSNGVLDVDAVGDEILVAYNNTYDFENGIGCYLSEDAGITWTACDSGIASEDYPYSYLYSAQRSPLNPMIAFAYNGAMFKSTNEGRSWSAETERGIIAQQVYLKWHPLKGNVIWFYGSGSFFNPIMGYIDVDNDRVQGFDMVKILPFVDNTCFDVTFDAIDNEVVYVGTFGMVIKTEDYGDTWIVPLFEHPQGGFFKALEGHPTIHNLTFFAGGRTLFVSEDGGKTYKVIESPNETQIFDMVYDEKREQLIIGSENGVYGYVGGYEQ